MTGNFNPQILVDKLSKLNMSQQSIETLSHWCIFHMNKAKQVVETWDRQFHCSPREQRLAFLYLANDILQNSRRKGVEFVTEFWKVLPDSLRDVIENGDESGKKAALRLVNIWEERKVFGSRGQLLKIELQKRPLENGNRSARPAGSINLKSPGGVLDKLAGGYQSVYCSQLDEEAILTKCRTAISFVEKVEKDFGGDYRLGHVNSSITDELKGQSVVLRDNIEQLKMVESARESLIALLREALQEQENKLEQVRDQVQVAQMRSEQAIHICQQLQLLGGSSVNGNVTPASQAPQTLASRHQQQASTVVYTRQVSAGPEISSHADKDSKLEAAAVAAKLMAASSSAQMVNFVLSSLASGRVLNPPGTESSSDYPPEKKAKIDAGQQSSYSPTESHPVPPPDEPNPEEHPPPPPSSPPPPLPPLPEPLRPYQVPQYTHVYSVPYTYNMPQPQLVAAPQITNYGAPVAGLPMAGVSQYPAVPPNIYQGYPGEGGYYTHP